MVKTLLRSVREYKKASIATPLLVFFEVILECIIPFVIAEMVELIESQDTVNIGTVLKYGGVVVILALLSLAFGTIAGVTSAKASCGFAKNLRHDLYYSVQDFSFENIDRFSTSSLITRLTTDVAYVQNAYMMLIRMAIRSPFMFIFAIVAAFITGGNLAWIFVISRRTSSEISSSFGKREISGSENPQDWHTLHSRAVDSMISHCG